MAKGESRLAGVTVDRDAPGDPRFAYLAKLLGLANQYEALGRMVLLWSTCTALTTDRPPLAKIAACFGDRRAPASLLEADLADGEVEDGKLRIKGCRGRVEWFEELPSQQAKAGRARAAVALRDEKGRLQRKPAGSHGGAGDLDQRAGVPLDDALGEPSSDGQRYPAQVQEQDVPDGVCRSGSSPSASGATGGPRRDLVQPPPIERGSARAAGVPVPPAPPLHDRAAGDVASDRRQVPQPPPPDVARNQALVKRFVDGINAARARVQLALGLRDVRPISHMHGSEATLLDRVRGVASAEADIDHVIEVKEEEAVDTGDMRWLGWTVCQPGAWRVALAAVPGSRKKAKPIGAPPSSPAKFDPLPPRVEMSEEERAEMSKLALAIAADPNKAARGAKP